MGLFSVLGIVFIVLKLTSVIAWSWVWVLSPFWIACLFWLIGLFYLAISSYNKKG